MIRRTPENGAKKKKEKRKKKKKKKKKKKNEKEKEKGKETNMDRCSIDEQMTAKLINVLNETSMLV